MKIVIVAFAALSLAVLAGATLTPALAAGPRVSEDSTWPGMSRTVPADAYQPANNSKPRLLGRLDK